MCSLLKTSLRSPLLWSGGQASASRAADLGPIPAFAGGLFSGSSHTSDLEIGTPVVNLQDAWCYWVKRWD